MPTSAARSRLYFLQGFPWAIFREGHKVRCPLDGSTWTALSGCLAGLPGMSWGQAVAQQSSGPPPGARASTVTLLVEEQPGCFPGCGPPRPGLSREPRRARPEAERAFPLSGRGSVLVAAWPAVWAVCSWGWLCSRIHPAHPHPDGSRAAVIWSLCCPRAT